MPTPPRPGPVSSLAALGLITLAVCAPGTAHSQLRFGARAGIIATSNLVRDSIVEPISVRPNAAVYVGGSVDGRLDPRYRVGASIQYTRSDVVSRTPTAETAITTLTVWHPAVTIAQQVTGWVALEAKLGLLIYKASRRIGTIFRDGAPVEPVIGLSVAATRPIGSRLEAALDVGYDVHRFSTTTLRIFGFTGETTVHRLAIGITLRASDGTPSR